jgi:trehalose-phosphatase
MSAQKGSLLAPAGMLRRIAAAPRVFWFLDFDGTLVGIRRDPEKVALGSDTREAVAGISSRENARVAVVSGRPLVYIRRQVALKDVVCAGNHGLEMRGPGVSFLHPEAVDARPALLRTKKAWSAIVPRFRGALVEDKGLSVTFHYRRVRPSLAEGARKEALATARRTGEEESLRITGGKMVVEVRPSVEWGKGEALRYLLGRWGYCRDSDLAVVIGDDETDRDMFAPVRSRGLAVFVGRGEAPPEANGRLRGPAEVRGLLRRAARLSG